MLGPSSDNLACCITWLIVILLETSFQLFISPYLWLEVTPALPIISGHLFLFSIMFMFLTSLTDPGIIPRKQIFQLTGSFPEVFSTEGAEKRKFCKTCQIYRPERSSHCKICDNCIEVFDHHCPFVSACIGKNNYRYFMSMVVVLTLLGGVNVSGMILFLCRDFQHGHNGRALIEDKSILISLALIITVPIILLTLLVMLLCMFHVRICISGETTKEKLVSREKGKNRSLFCEAPEVWFNGRMRIDANQMNLCKNEMLELPCV